MLTTQQISHFGTFGFLHLRQILSPAEMQDITREADELWREGLENQVEEAKHQHVVPFVEKRCKTPRVYKWQ